jgi:hypothetical protein
VLGLWVQEYLCKRIMEEMKYFKMELENRDNNDMIGVKQSGKGSKPQARR